jgi:hypothetical protein
MRRIEGMRRIAIVLLAAAGALTGSASLAATASAEIPACSGQVTTKTIYSGLGRLESILTGNSGRMYLSEGPAQTSISRLLKIEKPGATPATVTDGPGGQGGLAWNKRRLLWGYGNSAENGGQGDTNPISGLFSVNPVNGKKFTVSDRLGMANGIVRAKDGTIYASNDFGMKLDRITPAGVTQNGWATIDSANGMVISPDQKYIYAAQTFSEPSAISRIEIANPSNITTWASTAGVITGNPIFDGLARDDKGNLYVTAWAAGEVWKIDRQRRFCILATGLGRPSTLTFGFSKTGFRAGNLYVAGFTGDVFKITGAREATYPG